MKNILLKYCLSGVAGFCLLILNACEEDRWGNAPNLNDNIGAVTLVNVNQDKSFFNALNNLATETVEFTLDVDGFDVTQVDSVEIQVTYTESNAAKDLEGNLIDVTYPSVLLKTVKTFPSTVDVTGQEIMDAIADVVKIQKKVSSFTIDSLEVGDGFNLTFPIHTADGRRLTTALNSDLCQEPLQPSFGGCNVQWFISCPSNIATGAYTTLTTGQSTDDCCTAPVVDFPSEVNITSTSPGVYTVDDIFAGLYIEWYAGYGVNFKVSKDFSDVCNNLSASFSDPFGGAVTMSGTFDPATGVISFQNSNEYGDTWTSTWTPK